MSDKKFIILVLSVFIIALSVTVLVACDNERQGDLILPEAYDDETICTLPNPDFSAPGQESYTECELPPESFVGTVIEEDTYYMIVEPNIDEEEYEICDAIRVEYIHEHRDYLYGKGTKVLITYIPPIVGNKTITTDDIRAGGFEDFTLSVQYHGDSIPSNFAEIHRVGISTLAANSKDFDEYANDFNLYYYGLYDVYVSVDGNTLPLVEALSYGKVTLDGIIAECQRLSSIGKIKSEIYKDGGSTLYDFGDYKIIKYHTLDGNRDIYIGTKDMDINALNSTEVCVGAYLWKDWGVRLKAENVTCDGATIVFTQKGGNVTGELQTGEAFYLEKLCGNKWVSVSTRPTIDYAFHMVAYMLNLNGETELETEWLWLYDSLPEGKYRIAKEVDDFRGTGDFNKQFYFAYFEIGGNEK